MSTIADYSVFTKAFLASGMTDFSQLYGTKFQGEEAEGLFRAFAVIPFYLETPLTPREAMNFDRSKLVLNSASMARRVSCRDANRSFIGNIVRVQPNKRDGSIRFVAKVAVPGFVSSESENNPADAPYNTFVLVRTDASTNMDLPIAVATISKGYNLHKHKVVVTNVNEQFDVNFDDPLDDVENANYVSFTINNLNGYTSVDFNPDAYATYDDVANALSRGIDGLHIAFDTASGDLKLLDKDGNVLDQANLPIKADVIIADGEEGYKYVKTDVKQDIHAAKAWMPEGFTAWDRVDAVPYTRKHAALVVGNASTPASKVFVSTKPVFSSPISTESVPLEHVVIEGSTYLLVNKTEKNCHLRKVKGKAEATLEISAGISGGQVTLNDSSNPYPILTGDVEVDVIEYKGVTYVLVGPEGPGRFKAQPISGESAGSYHDTYSGSIVTLGGSTTASKVFVDPHSGSFPISTESVNFDHVEIGNSIYMLTDKNETGTGTTCTLRKVKGEAVEQVIWDAVISGTNVTLNDPSSSSYPIDNGTVEVEVIKGKGEGEGGVTTTYVLVETDRPDEPGSKMFQAWHLDGTSSRYSGIIVTSGGTSTGGVVGITLDGQSMYTFEEGATTPLEFKDSSGNDVTWFGTKAIPEGYTLKYGLEAFVWTVKDAEDTISDSFFQQLNASLLALGFHEGDDIALGTNLATLAPTEGVSPLNKVDANDYMHGKDKKAIREQEVDAQRANAKEELVAWNAQHPALEENREYGTIIDSSGLDVRSGSITLGCGRTGEAGKFQKINYGIQMGQRYGVGEDRTIYDSLDFTVSHHTGKVQFDENGHAAQPGGNNGLTSLTSSTLLSIEAGSYISGAPTCLILAEVAHNLNPNPEGGPTVFTPVRMTAGFSVAPSYSASSGLQLTIQDYRDNIKALLNHDGHNETAPSIIEVQAIYTHHNAETVPAQQMHTYIGEWDYNQAHPSCSFLCNKIEEWMTAVGLADTNPAEGVKLYVVIRVY